MSLLNYSASSDHTSSDEGFIVQFASESMVGGPTLGLLVSGEGLFGDWFESEVWPHEQSLRSYLRQLPHGIDIDDLIQEVYLRIWQVRVKRPIESTKSYLFAIARNLAFDFSRRRKISPIVSVVDFANVCAFDEQPGVAESVSTKESTDLLAEAIAALPLRCREVLTLRKLQGLSQRETALRLSISERTVEVQVAKAVKRCEEYLRQRGVTGYYGGDAGRSSFREGSNSSGFCAAGASSRATRRG
jgi:RNA polymerase sigma factor (sigma-70 family)